MKQSSAHVYDWLMTIGGGEKTLSALLEIFPAPIYTLVHHQDKVDPQFFGNVPIYSSFLQKLPFVKQLYRHYLPLFPLAIEQFDLSQHDLILSTSHAVAKGVLTQAHQLHICYCFTPMRYAWDLTHRYLETLSMVQKMAAKVTLHYLRQWDIASLNRVDHFIAISHYIAKRIQKNYGREAAVIYPPVDTHLIPFRKEKENFYLTVSRMVPYKRIDLIVEAFSKLKNETLVVIGDGPEMKRIQAKAGKNVELLGRQKDAIVQDYLGRAKGFIFAAEEDFGISVVEAQAAGTAVIAFGKGATLETVIDQKTGVFFLEQTVESLLRAINKFETIDFDPEFIRQMAERFSKDRFQKEFKQFVERRQEEHYESHHLSWR